ncbi:hypothetical protein CDL12_13230 [Handroanthus impetiginosus]|uniref:Uncharacterized protein n=1 Tax=Handroanthus impetiginosus TaxID=429701 RepID=A0A2G9H9B3_9LAMI|nr:hypothetical protein CDL12_13230 [Handroanthus impetiginosus]
MGASIMGKVGLSLLIPVFSLCPVFKVIFAAVEGFILWMGRGGFGNSLIIGGSHQIIQVEQLSLSFPLEQSAFSGHKNILPGNLYFKRQQEYVKYFWNIITTPFNEKMMYNG